AAEGRARTAHQWDGGHLLHPGRGAQPPGALGRPRTWRSCEGSPGRPLQGRPRHPRRRRCERSQEGALPVRRQGQVAAEMPRRARTLAVRWLVEFSRARREKTMAERLAGELLDAQSEQGGAYKRKEDIYRMAQANKAFAHYRW